MITPTNNTMEAHYHTGQYWPTYSVPTGYTPMKRKITRVKTRKEIMEDQRREVKDMKATLLSQDMP